MRLTAKTSSLVAALIAVTAVACSADPQPVTRKPSSKTPTTTPTPDEGVDDLPPVKPSEQAPPAGTEVGSEVWKDGKQLAASVSVKAGSTVEIEAGATVTASAGVAITVNGTLTVKPGAAHAKITGANWKGIVVASGGTLVVDGLDITNAENGVWTLKGNLDAKVTNALITSAAAPFKMEAGSKLSVIKSKVVKATGASLIAGTFTASYLDYDKGSAEGLELNDAAGSMTISDSTLRGLGGGDYVVSRAGKLVKVEYTTITGSHCGLHFSAVDQYIIDHVSDDQNSYGAMLYGSGAGPNQIISSNIRSTDKDLDMSGVNGTLTIDKSFTGGKNTLQANATITNAATVAIADAKPR
jgi:hypothetical protein